MKSPPFCAIINLLDYDTWKGAFFMGRKNPAKNINIGLLAHVDAGKTTLSEALLYATGQIRALGRVDHQDAFLDTDAQERARGITIFWISRPMQFYRMMAVSNILQLICNSLRWSQMVNPSSGMVRK